MPIKCNDSRALTLRFSNRWIFHTVIFSNATVVSRKIFTITGVLSRCLALNAECIIKERKRHFSSWYHNKHNDTRSNFYSFLRNEKIGVRYFLTLPDIKMTGLYKFLDQTRKNALFIKIWMSSFRKISLWIFLLNARRIKISPPVGGGEGLNRNRSSTFGYFFSPKIKIIPRDRRRAQYCATRGTILESKKSQ